MRCRDGYASILFCRKLVKCGEDDLFVVLENYVLAANIIIQL
jgi:hypothetical protein